MTRVPLSLGKHFLLIDSPISFYLIDNEENSTYRPSGVWQLDTWKLLPEKYQKDHPVYTLMIEYDESKLADGKKVSIRESDIDLGEGVAGVSGQAVQLTGINENLVPFSVKVLNDSLSCLCRIDSISESVFPFRSVLEGHSSLERFFQPVNPIAKGYVRWSPFETWQQFKNYMGYNNQQARFCIYQVEAKLTYTSGETEYFLVDNPIFNFNSDDEGLMGMWHPTVKDYGVKPAPYDLNIGYLEQHIPTSLRYVYFVLDKDY